MNIFSRIWLERKANVPAFSSYITEKELEELRASRTAESQKDDEAMNATEDKAQNNSSTNKTSTVKNDKDSDTIEIKAEDFEVKSETEKAASEENADSATTEAPYTKTIVEEMGEAAMGAASTIVKPSMTGVDFGFFVKQEPEKVMPNPGFYKPVTPDSYMSYNQAQQEMRPPFMGQQPAQGMQFEAYPGANNPMQQPMNQQQNPATQAQTAAPQNTVVGKGRHKVDNPPKQKPEVKKAEPAKVDVDLDLIVKPEVKEPTVRKVPDVVQDLPKAEAAPTPEAKFDNEALISQYKYLGEIERVARECGAQVKYEMRPGSNGKPSGLITCLTFTENDINRPNPFKSFTIDTGKIIDRRAKILIGDPTVMAYEDMQMYLILVNSKDSDDRSKNRNNVFNEKLFKDIFVGGYQMLEPSRMYTKELLALNKYVALITMPTNNMNSESRKAVRDRLLAAMKADVFKKVLEKDPKARFRFDNYKKETMEFTLTTAGTPYRFCGPCMATKKIKIDFRADGTAVPSEE